jgi:uncharacterized membrane protein HdeD (DUF308 family)
MSKRQERKAEIATAAKHRVDEKLGHIWWAILLRGVLALGLAICAFVWPEKTLSIFVKLLGAYFLIDGVIGAISAFRSTDKTSPLLQTIVSLAIGLVLLLWADVSGKIFLILVGVWLALQGVGLFLAAVKMDRDDGARGLTMAIGGVMALIGIVFVVWTDTGVVAISWLVGIGALLVGGLLIFLATRVKQLRSRIDGIGQK